MAGAKLSKGVSEIVTTVMLIMIVASVGIGILLYSMGYFSNVTSSREQMYSQDINKLKEHFLIADATLINNTNANVYVYNYGSIGVTISALYVDGGQMTLTGPQLINPNSSAWINSTNSFSSNKPNVGFAIKVVSSLGNYYEDYYALAH
jgi:flagellin-like protein